MRRKFQTSGKFVRLKGMKKMVPAHGAEKHFIVFVTESQFKKSILSIKVDHA